MEHCNFFHSEKYILDIDVLCCVELNSLRCDWTYSEEPPVVLNEHQSHINDGSTVFDAHGVDVMVYVCASLLLQQVGPEDHREVGSCHLVPWNLQRKSLRKQRMRRRREKSIKTPSR